MLEVRSRAEAERRFGTSADRGIFHFGSPGGDFSSAVGRQLAVVVCGARRHPVLSGHLFVVFGQHGRRMFVRRRACGCQAWIP